MTNPEMAYASASAPQPNWQTTDATLFLQYELAEAIDSGIQPWVRPWERNAHTNGHGRAYLPVAQLWLSLGNPEESRWFTLAAATLCGARPKPNARPTWVQGVFPGAGGPGDGRISCKTHWIYNRSQLEGGKLSKPRKAKQVKVVTPPLDETRLLAWLQALGVAVREGERRAYYQPSMDAITLPPKQAFASEHCYYATLLHEVAHWTGEGGRCNRTHDYATDHGRALEEMVAEFTACQLARRFGVTGTQQSHNSYLRHWSMHLRCGVPFLDQVAREVLAALRWLDQRSGTAAQGQADP